MRFLGHLIDHCHVWRDHGSPSQCRNAARCEFGRSVPDGILQCAICHGSKLADLQYCGEHEEELFFWIYCHILWFVPFTCRTKVSCKLTCLISALGNIIGPQFFLERQAPHYQLGMGALLTSFAVMAAAGIGYYLHCIRENSVRDKKFGKPSNLVEAGISSEEEDLTDIQNSKFRYTY